MAKQQASRYRPGKRSSAWRKIKPAGVLPCVIIGYTPGREGVHSVQLATVRDGILRHVGQLRQGFGPADRAALARVLKARRRLRPVVPCPQPACWVEPELYCHVHFQEWTCHGYLRHAVFGEWLEGPR